MQRLEFHFSLYMQRWVVINTLENKQVSIFPLLPIQELRRRKSEAYRCTSPSIAGVENGVACQAADDVYILEAKSCVTMRAAGR